MSFPAGPLRGVCWQRRLDDAAALVLCRPNDFLDEGVGDAVDVVFRIHDEEIDGAGEAAGDDGWPEGENRPTDDVAPGLGDKDARLREIDQLSEQVRWAERAGSAGQADDVVAQRDEPIDVRDASGSDQIFHAG